MIVTYRTVTRGCYAWLSDDDLQWCRAVAQLRTSNSRQGKLQDQKYSTASSDTIDLQGVLGEYGLCKILDVDPRAQIDETGENQCAATDTFDIRFGPITIDVKCVRGDRHFPLLVTAKKYENPASHYCLVSIRGCPTSSTLPDCGPVQVVFEGSATGEQVFNHANIKMPQPGAPRWAKPMFEVGYDALTCFTWKAVSPYQYASTGSCDVAETVTQLPLASLDGK